MSLNRIHQRWKSLSLRSHSDRKNLYRAIALNYLVFTLPFLLHPQLSRFITSEGCFIELSGEISLLVGVIGWIILFPRAHKLGRLWILSYLFLTALFFLEEISWGTRMAGQFLYTGGFKLPPIKLFGHEIDSLHDLIGARELLSYPIIKAGIFSGATLLLMWGVIAFFSNRKNSILFGTPARYILLGVFLIIFSELFELFAENYLIVNRYALYWLRYPEEFIEMLGCGALFIAMLEASFILPPRNTKISKLAPI